MARTSLTGYARQYGSGKGATPAVHMSIIQFTLDISQASTTGTGKFMPKGAIPIGAENFSGNGTPVSTIDIGIAGDPDAFANELFSFIRTNREVDGVLLGIELTADIEITAGAGATSGTGNVLVGVYYMMADDGSA